MALSRIDRSMPVPLCCGITATIYSPMSDPGGGNLTMLPSGLSVEVVALELAKDFALVDWRCEICGGPCSENY